MRAHQMNGDVITNTIVVDSLDVLPNLIDASIGGQIGDSIVNGVVVPAPVPAPQVPKSVTMQKARRALRQAGLIAAVEAAIDAMPSPQREFARDEWEYSGEVHRDRGLVLNMGTALGLSSAQLDALFISAAALP